ncbi:MAG TPA: hypothetical protein ENK18_14905 [Deltaproteobacteria bacterium]|nr:hypothetical protein [Deltaproteobacteria bacterium]
MLSRFGALYYLSGVARGLSRIRLEEHAATKIRDASERGPVVYLLPRRSALDHLALNAAIVGSKLPLSAWSPGVSTRWWQPVGIAWRGLWSRIRRGVPDPVRSGWIREALRAGHALTLYRDPRPGWLSWRQPAPTEVIVPLLEAVDARPVQVVPVEIVWNRAPESASLLTRFFQGIAARPGTLRRLWRLWRGADAFVQVGDPIDLGALQERVPRARLSGVLLRMAARSLNQETKLVRGPRLLPHRAMKRRVLHTPPIRELAKQEAQIQGITEGSARRRIAREYDRIAANFSWSTIKLLHLVLRPLWTRVFSGVDVRPADLEHLRRAMRDGTPILIPCHKSHFDYLLLSWALYDNDLIVPHVIAGMNMAVWPISIVLRGAGGFFIKRSFSGDRLFPPLFSRYLRELIRQEYPIEFFIEGGRTRSGKLLPPRLGVLSMVLEAASVRRRGREVTLLPMAFAYEQIAEERAYTRERRGRSKRPESLGQILRASSVLRHRYGRAYLRVGAPILCGPLVDATGDQPGWADRAPEQRQARLEHLGAQIVHRISTVVVLLPTSVVALGLLAHHRRAIRHTELMERLERLASLITSLGAPRAASLDRFEQAITGALDRFLLQGMIEELDHLGERIWSVIPEERLALDFHKNQVLHYLAPAGMAAIALRTAEGSTIEPDTLLEPFIFIQRLWRREFVGDPDLSPADALHQGLDDLEIHGAIQRDPRARIVEIDPVRIGEIYALFLPLLEAYVLVLRADHLPPMPTATDLARALLEEQAAWVERGVITRPEALSIETLKNAIAILREDGVVEVGPDERLRVDGAAAGGHLEGMEAMVGT